MDWPNRFPYLVPVWHSLSNQNLKNKAFNKLDPNFDIELGGIGTFNNIRFKNHLRLPYKINRPMLPFFIDETNHKYSKYSAYNCLAFCPRRKVLFSSKEDQINCLDLELQERFIGTYDVNCQINHSFSLGQKTAVNPFCFNISNISIQKGSRNYIVDLKLYENNNDLELIAHSRNSLDIFTHQVDESERSHLKHQVNINSFSNCFPSSESLLNMLDRNPEFPEEFLTSFINDPNIYQWNIETRTLKVDKKLEVDILNAKNQLINIEFIKRLNPFLYIFGTHKNISLGDTRQNIYGSKVDAISLVDAEDFLYFKPFELFQTFVVNPIECHQFITTSDFNVNFFDIRYPNKNLFQCKHMLSDQLVNKLVPIENRLPVSTSSNESLFLLASNHIKTCLFTFNCKLAVQPSMLHTPFYVESPHSINKLFPFESDRSFIRGMQILVNDFYKNGNGFFTIAFLLNNGDIFMQDFWSTTNHEDIHLKNHSDLNEFMYENHVGKKIYFNTELDIITKEYMETIIKYLDHKKAHNRIDLRDYISMKSGFCQNCFEDLLNQGVFRIDENDSVEILNRNLSCSENCANFCTCLRSHAEIQEELEFLSNARSEQENILSTEGSIILDKNIIFRDNDQIDFELIKQNWFKCENNSTIGVRQFCRPLTQKLFDPWCRSIIEDEKYDNQESNQTNITM